MSIIWTLLYLDIVILGHCSNGTFLYWDIVILGHSYIRPMLVILGTDRLEGDPCIGTLLHWDFGIL